MKSVFCYTFFGVQCEVFTTPFVLPSHPWLFRIFGKDGIIQFAGVPINAKRYNLP